MKSNKTLARQVLSFSLTLVCPLILCGPAQADRIKHQVTGLFMKEREQDLRDAVAKMPEVKLVSIDFNNAEAVFDYDPAKLFPGAKPAEFLQRFDNLLRFSSTHTFGVKPLCSIPVEKLQRIEIPVAGLDCKACSMAAYEAVCRVQGVERATASFREGRVTAWIDPSSTDRARLEEALKKIGVEVNPPRKAP